MMTKRVWLSLAGLAGIGLAVSVFVIAGWMVNETRFQRPSEDFDRLTSQVESVPGVSIEDADRWVEAPFFSATSSRIELTVDADSLRGLLDTACSTDHPEAVSWSFHVRAGGGDIVSVHSDTEGEPGQPCPDFGFDVVGFVSEVQRIAPGLDVQPTIWEDGQFAIVALDDQPGETNGLGSLLPLVDHADDLRAAAGLEPRRSVELNAGTLGVVLEPDEHDRYLALLSDLVEEHGVTSYWADDGGPADGVGEIQVIAPDHEQTVIEVRIRTSDLQIADVPIRFIPQDS